MSWPAPTRTPRGRAQNDTFGRPRANPGWQFQPVLQLRVRVWQFRLEPGAQKRQRLEGLLPPLGGCRPTYVKVPLGTVHPGTRREGHRSQGARRARSQGARNVSD